jgi:hypothetical protein
MQQCRLSLCPPPPLILRTMLAGFAGSHLRLVGGPSSALEGRFGAGGNPAENADVVQLYYSNKGTKATYNRGPSGGKLQGTAAPSADLAFIGDVLR